MLRRPGGIGVSGRLRKRNVPATPVPRGRAGGKGLNGPSLPLDVGREGGRQLGRVHHDQRGLLQPEGAIISLSRKKGVRGYQLVAG